MAKINRCQSKLRRLTLRETRFALFNGLKQGPRSSFLLVGLIEHQRCDISRGETFEIKSPEMPGNTSNFNNHHEVAYSFCLDSYIFNASICIEQKLLVGL